MEINGNRYQLSINGALPKSKQLPLTKDENDLDSEPYTETENQAIKNIDTPSKFVKEIKAAIQNWAGSRVIRYYLIRLMKYPINISITLWVS
jgi:hypothetical protein